MVQYCLFHFCLTIPWIQDTRYIQIHLTIVVRIPLQLYFIYPQLSNGEMLQLPPVVVGTLGKDLNKLTVCIYGHADVQPAKKGGWWATEPYILTEMNGQNLLHHIKFCIILQPFVQLFSYRNPCSKYFSLFY